MVNWKVERINPDLTRSPLLHPTPAIPEISREHAESFAAEYRQGSPEFFVEVLEATGDEYQEQEPAAGPRPGIPHIEGPSTTRRRW